MEIRNCPNVLTSWHFFHGPKHRLHMFRQRQNSLFFNVNYTRFYVKELVWHTDFIFLISSIGSQAAALPLVPI